MSVPDKPERRVPRPNLLPLAILLFVIVPVVYSLASGAIAASSGDKGAFLDCPEGNCLEGTPYEVEEPGWMRKHHWQFLRWLREEAVRYGRRGELSLNKCIECHGSREAFCNRCHEAVSLEPDCFGCHDYPR